jgi:Rrf2 family protein
MSRFFSISEAASIGIHSMVLIAKSENRLNVTNISEIMNFSRHHVAKVMQRMSKAGMVSSTRGPAGGFVLALDPSEISLLDIYEAIEGKIVDTECPLGYNQCPFNKCLLDNMADNVNKAFKEYLKSHTLEYYLKNGY